MKKIILTGDRPTGPLHLGHYIGSLRNRVALQNEYQQFVMIADVQALTDNAENPEKIRQNILEVALDYLAVGIDPKISTFFIQSMLPEIAELTMFYLNLVTIARLERNPTVKDEIKNKDFARNIPAGFLMYPVSQAADITIFNANLVPVGHDQLPMIEQTVEIVRKFNLLYGEIFIEPQALVPKEGGRLPGVDGKAKMSKSLGNAIYLGDAADVVTKKIMNMFTDPNHLRISDPGTVEGNVVFTYLDIFDPNKEELEELKAHYRRGGLGDVTIKRRLNDLLQAVLQPIRTQREMYANDKEAVLAILEDGTKAAREVAVATMRKVKKVMRIDYFASL
ncbi:MAG: tryptophan--tRNA ligase [Gammaproteobacteria bacterium GWE2_37_16]|nr:MAG: tryptophan--tRNA ligase [Gammaproteobacteria bacterium GWE2_37_16]